MRKPIYMVLAAGLLSFTATSCDSASENRAEEQTEEVGDDIEDAADDAGDEIEDAADEVEDETDR